MYGSESSSDGGWISWFIELEGHEFFVEVRSDEIIFWPHLSDFVPSITFKRLILPVWSGG